MLNIMDNWKTSGLGVAENQNMKGIIGRQIPDSPLPTTRYTSDLISRLTGLCVYLLYPKFISFSKQQQQQPE